MANNNDQKKRNADSLAGEGSILDRLRKRRLAMENYDAEAEASKPSDEDNKRGYTQQAFGE